MARELTLRQACQAAQHELIKFAAWRETSIAAFSEPVLWDKFVIVDALLADGVTVRGNSSLSGEWSSAWTLRG